MERISRTDSIKWFNKQVGKQMGLLQNIQSQIVYWQKTCRHSLLPYCTMNLTMFLHQHIVVCIKTPDGKPAHKPVNYMLSNWGLYFKDVLDLQQCKKTLHNFTASLIIL